MKTNCRRATIPSSVPPPPSGDRRLELAQQPEDDVPHPGGVLGYETTRWIRLARDSFAVVFALAPGIDRIGVTVSVDGRYISYREAAREEAYLTVEELQVQGFTAEEIRP